MVTHSLRNVKVPDSQLTKFEIRNLNPYSPLHRTVNSWPFLSVLYNEAQWISQTNVGSSRGPGLSWLNFFPRDGFTEWTIYCAGVFLYMSMNLKLFQNYCIASNQNRFGFDVCPSVPSLRHSSHEKNSTRQDEPELSTIHSNPQCLPPSVQASKIRLTT